MRSVVPARQLPVAVAGQTGRSAAASLAGPPLGGALFGLSRALPFVADAVSCVFSFVSLILMRTPFQEPRESARPSVRAQLAERFRFLWGQPFLRTSTFLYGLTNSGSARRVRPDRMAMLLELWARPGPLAFLIWPNMCVLVALILPAAMAIPVTDSVVIGYRLVLIALLGTLSPAIRNRPSPSAPPGPS